MLNKIPYDFIKFLGWFTVILVILSATFHFSLLLNKALAKSKNPTANSIKAFLRKVLPIVRKLHPFIGSLALITGISHGYLMVRSVMLHSGYITWLFLLLLAISGSTMKIFRKKSFYKPLRKVHTIFMYCTIVMIVFHVFL